MSLEALPTSNDFPNFLIYDTISASPTNFFFPNNNININNNNNNNNSVLSFSGEFVSTQTSPDIKPGQQRRKRRRKPKSSKNKEEAETQRMTHIAVERNRRRQMNEHLSVLRSLMPDCYIQRGDQASIVGGAIDFVKELEQLLQSLEAQKRKVFQEQEQELEENKSKSELDLPPFSDFFTYPQYIRFHAPRDYFPSPPSPETHHHHRTPALADIEVTLIESHANLRILSPRRPRQLLKLVAGLQALSLTILHLNVTSLDFMVLYSLSTKVEEGCGLTTIEEIAAAVHHMLSLIEAVTPAHSQ